MELSTFQEQVFFAVSNTQLQAIPTNTTVGVQQTMGLGIVIKAQRVKEIIEFAMTKIVPNQMASNPPPTETNSIQPSN